MTEQHISPTTLDYTFRVTVELIGPETAAIPDGKFIAADAIEITAPLDVLMSLAQQAGKPAAAIATRMIGIEWRKAQDANRRFEDDEDREIDAP